MSNHSKLIIEGPVNDWLWFIGFSPQIFQNMEVKMHNFIVLIISCCRSSKTTDYDHIIRLNEQLMIIDIRRNRKEDNSGFVYTIHDLLNVCTGKLLLIRFFRYFWPFCFILYFGNIQCKEDELIRTNTY